MQLHSKSDIYTLYEGSMLDMLECIEPNSVESIVTDPPYELGFMDKDWDNSGIAFQSDTWRKCYEVLKPGGYLLAFGGSRTFHRIAVAIEDAGFEIRDTIMWLYGSGFPKSMNLGKAVESKLTTGSANTQEWKGLKGTKAKSGDWGYNRANEFFGARPSDYSADGHERTVDVDYQTEEGKTWDGWGTCLKPAYEPIIVARKPCDGSVTDNVLKYGVGGLNIDECRIGVGSGNEKPKYVPNNKNKVYGRGLGGGDYENTNGRFPANVILTYDETDEQEVCGNMPYTEHNGSGITTMPKMGSGSIGVCNYGTVGGDRAETNYIAPIDSGSAARYFYCAKASNKDRDEGLEQFERKQYYYSDNKHSNSLEIFGSDKCTDRKPQLKRNNHPTVKPMELMQYLIKLVTPKNGTILDPFNGSGSTGKAVAFENRCNNKNYKYIGIELNKEYLDISKARIDYANTVNLNMVNKNINNVSTDTPTLF